MDFYTVKQRNDSDYYLTVNHYERELIQAIVDEIHVTIKQAVWIMETALYDSVIKTGNNPVDSVKTFAYKIREFMNLEE